MIAMVISADLTADPSTPPDVLAPVKPVSFQDAWSLCDSERFRAITSAGVARAKGAEDIAAYHERHAATFALLQTLIDRIGRDEPIKAQLREIARVEAEREAALAALDNPDKAEA